MSKGRLIVCYSLTAAALLAAAWFAVGSFPLEASPGVQIQSGAVPQDQVYVSVSGFEEPVLSRMRERLAEFQGRPYTFESRAEITRAAREIDPAARVPFMNQIETPEGSLLTTFIVSTDRREPTSSGTVPFVVSRLSGPVRIDVSQLPEPLRSTMRTRLALYDGQPYTLELRFAIARLAAEVDPRAGLGQMAQWPGPDGSITTTLWITLSRLAGEQNPSVSQGPLHLDVSRLPEPLRSATQARLASLEGQLYTSELRNQVTRALVEVNPKARWALIPQKPEDSSLGTTLSIVLTDSGVGVGRGLGQGFPSSGRLRIPVPGFAQAVRLIESRPPEYPPLAQQARIQGTVRFSAVIDTVGRVANLTLVSGHPLLVPAAQEAVARWLYQPTLLDGQPVEVTTQIDVSFTLPANQPPMP